MMSGAPRNRTWEVVRRRLYRPLRSHSGLALRNRKLKKGHLGSPRVALSRAAEVQLRVEDLREEGIAATDDAGIDFRGRAKLITEGDQAFAHPWRPRGRQGDRGRMCLGEHEELGEGRALYGHRGALDLPTTELFPAAPTAGRLRRADDDDVLL